MERGRVSAKTPRWASGWVTVSAGAPTATISGWAMPRVPATLPGWVLVTLPGWVLVTVPGWVLVTARDLARGAGERTR